MKKLGKLYLIDTNGTARIVDENIEMANGLGLSPDNRTLYFTDSAARTIYAYDVSPSNGELRNKRVFAHIGGNEGLPDGLTVDAQGFILSAQWFGAQIVRYDPEGKVERRITMPVTQISSMAFAGDDLTDLYITTAADHTPSPLAQPGYDYARAKPSGALYHMTIDVPGRLEHQARLREPRSVRPA